MMLRCAAPLALALVSNRRHDRGGSRWLALGLAAAAILLALPATEAHATGDVVVGPGQAHVVAGMDQDTSPDPTFSLQASDAEQFADGRARDADSQMDFATADQPDALTIQGDSSSTCSATSNATDGIGIGTDQLMTRQFQVTSPLQFSLTGQLTQGRADLREVALSGFGFQTQAEGSFNESGVLPPGNYDLRIRNGCLAEADPPTNTATGSSGFDVTLDVGGAAPSSTTITSGPSGTVTVPDAHFEFSTTNPSPPPGGFECRLDGQGTDPFTPCVSPQDFSGLADGQHVFEVRYHPTGDVPGPVAQRSWTIDTGCPDVQVGFATAKGCFTETAPASGIFETDQKAWVGGFQIEPRGGGKLVLNTNTRDVSTSGAGADMVFAGFKVPIPVGALPVNTSQANVQFGGGAGTVAEVLDIPVEASVKVKWTNGGRSASYEQKVAIKKLTQSIGPMVTPPGTVLGDFGGELKATLENGTGFVLQQGEVSIKKVTLLPDKLKIPKQLELRDLLLRFQRKNNKPFWTGRGGITLPFRDGLGFTGTVFTFDGSVAGGGLAISGINKQLGGTPLFLQEVSGDLLFAPDWGHDLTIKASGGPRVNGKQLLTLTGQMKGGELIAPTDCPSGDDPERLLVSSKLTPLEPLELAGVASSTMSLRSCVYPYAGLVPAMDVTATIGIDFANGGLAYESSQTGFVSDGGANLEGAATLKIPALPNLNGSAILSTKGTAACATVGFFDAGFGHQWGAGPPSAFSGCDLAPFRVVAPKAAANAAGSGAIEVPKGLPHAGFAATAKDGPPRVTVSGPGGVELSSPADGSVLRNENALIVPVANENTTYVFVRKPQAGSWQVDSADPDNPLTKVSFARGLDDPKVKAKVQKPRGKHKKGKGGKRFKLAYNLKRIPGQEVTFTERGEGIATELGKARGRKGTISFKPTVSADRKRTIEAEVVQDGLPRELLTVAKFKAPKQPKIKKPKAKAKRKKTSLKLSWKRVKGAADYLVEVSAGTKVLNRVITPQRKLRLDGTPPEGKLNVTIQALGEVQPPGPVKRLKVKPPKKRG